MGYDGSGLSVADAIALRDDNGCRNNDGFGDGGGWWMMFLFFLLAWSGNGYGGWGNNAGGAGLQGALTRADLCQDMNFSQLENGVRGIQQGLCDGFYAQNTTMLNGFNGLQNTVQNGFAGVDNAICNLGFNMQNGFNSTNVAMLQGQNALQAQLSQCCCDNRAGQADIKYQMATDTCAIQNTIQNATRDIIDNNNCNTRQILDFMVNDKISTLQAENQSLKLAASQADQNNFIAANQAAQTAELIRRLGADCPQPAYVVQPPQPVTFPTNCCGTASYGNYGNYNNNGCGRGYACGCDC